MKIIETELAKDLSDVLNKHGKTFNHDKHGIYIVDSNMDVRLDIISRAHSGSKDTKNKIIF
jgi:hypothetical protein